MTEPVRTAFSGAVYQQARDLGDTYRASNLPVADGPVDVRAKYLAKRI